MTTTASQVHKETSDSSTTCTPRVNTQPPGTRSVTHTYTHTYKPRKHTTKQSQVRKETSDSSTNAKPVGVPAEISVDATSKVRHHTD